MPDFDKNLSSIIKESPQEQFIPKVGPVKSVSIPSGATPDLSQTPSVFDGTPWVFEKTS